MLATDLRLRRPAMMPLPSRSIVNVEYPAFVRNVDACLETLGAHTGDLSKTLKRKARTMQLNFRPDDPSSRAIAGSKVSTTNLLVRVRRRKRPKGAPHDEAASEPTVATIVGTVDTTYRFEGMADFQWAGSLQHEPPPQQAQGAAAPSARTEHNPRPALCRAHS